MPAKRKIWRRRYIVESFGLAVLHTSAFSERDATTPRKLEEDVPSVGEPTEWPLSRWNIDDARGLVPDLSENAGDVSLQQLAESNASAVGSVLRQVQHFCRKSTKRVLKRQRWSAWLISDRQYRCESKTLWLNVLKKVPKHIEAANATYLWVVLCVSVGTAGSFPGVETAGAWTWPPTSIYCRGQG